MTDCPRSLISWTVSLISSSVMSVHRTPPAMRAVWVHFGVPPEREAASERIIIRESIFFMSVLRRGEYKPINNYNLHSFHRDGFQIILTNLQSLLQNKKKEDYICGASFPSYLNLNPVSLSGGFSLRTILPATNLWIWLVPSYIWSSFASRINFSAGYSAMYP